MSYSIDTILNKVGIPIETQYKIFEFNTPKNISIKLQNEIEIVTMSKRIIRYMKSQTEKYSIYYELINQAKPGVQIPPIDNNINVTSNLGNLLGVSSNHDTYGYWHEVYSTCIKLIHFILNPSYFNKLSPKEIINIYWEYEWDSCNIPDYTRSDNGKYILKKTKYNHRELSRSYCIIIHNAYCDFLNYENQFPDLFSEYFKNLMNRVNHFIYYEYTNFLK